MSIYTISLTARSVGGVTLKNLEFPEVSASNWGPRAETLYVTNFSIVNAKSDHGLTVLKDGPERVTKIANYPTGQIEPKDIDEACWSALSSKNDMLYVVSYVTNVITPFKLDPVSGKVLKRMPLHHTWYGLCTIE